MASTSTPISTTRVRRRWGGLNRREWIDGWLFFSPWLLGFLAFTFLPMGYSIYLIFLHWNLITPPTPAGLDNIKALFQDPLVPLSLYDTAFYTILGVPLQLTVALLLALALNAGLRRFLGDQGSLGLSLLPSGRRDLLDIKIRHGFVSLRS
jgi:multiple sugar transport system permease protein